MDDIRWYVPTISVIVAITLFLAWSLRPDKKSSEELEQERLEDARLYDADKDLKNDNHT